MDNNRDIRALEFLNSDYFSKLLLPILNGVLDKTIPAVNDSPETILKNAYRAELAKDIIDKLITHAALGRNELDKMDNDYKRADLKTPPREWSKLIEFYTVSKG